MGAIALEILAMGDGLGYNGSMSKNYDTLENAAPAYSEVSFAEAAHLQALEGNPLTADDIAMFQMFEREGWSDERRRAYIAAQVNAHAQAPAAE